MRLFIAINFTRNTLTRLLEIQDDLRGQSSYGRYTHVDNMHLTLVFLGECDSRKAAAAKAAMDEIDFNPFYIAVDHIGRFRRDGGDIWWAGIRENAKLLELQGGLAYSLAFSGFEIERRKFSPHITIGREIITPAVPWDIKPFGEPIGRVDLMQSERIGGRLTYSPIAELMAV